MLENDRTNYFIELLENYETDNLFELRLKEMEYINDLHPSLNVRMPLNKNLFKQMNICNIDSV